MEGLTKIRLLGAMLVIWFASSLVFLIYLVGYWEYAVVVSGVHMFIQLTMVCIDLVWNILKLRKASDNDNEQDVPL